MSFDLCVWDGPMPDSDSQAADEYERLMATLDDDPRPPTPAIREFVDALTSRWPEDVPDSVWADGRLIDDANGAMIYFAVAWSAADEVPSVAAALAAELGLVCYDPQAMRLV